MTVQNPHDRFFKRTFGEKETAVEFLDYYLPAPIRKRVSLESLTLIETTLVDEELAEHQSDLLYEIETNDEQPLFIYLLFEHKSYPDRWVHLQLLRYMLTLWQQEADKEKTVQLTPILPILIYHGEPVWPFADQFEGYFKGAGASLLPYLPKFDIMLKDFSVESGEKIQGTLRMQAILLALRRILDKNLRREFAPFIRTIFQLSGDESGLQLLELIVYYFTQATEKLDRQIVQTILAEQGQAGEMIMQSVGMEWKQEGIREGIQEGRREGLLQLLIIKFGKLPAALISQIQVIKDLDMLDELMRQAVHAESLDDIQIGS